MTIEPILARVHWQKKGETLMNNIGNLPGERLAGLSADLFHKVQKGVITLDEFALFVQRKAPFSAGRNFLQSTGNITLPARTNPFNPNEFYQNRDGLYVYDGFGDHILPATKTVDSISETIITSFDLVKQANDAEIYAELPRGHVFEDVSEFSAHLAGMIESQPNGKEGELIANGCANIFYVRGVMSEVFAVPVVWDSGDRRWRVPAFRLDDDRWGAGSRAFSSNC